MNKKDVEAIYPLSPAQQGMLFGTLSAPNSGIHIEQTSCILQGTLNVQAFEQAWQSVVNRHSILRTAFVWKNQDEPRQVVFRQVVVTINSQDWRKLEQSEQQKQLEDYLKADRQQGFDFSKPPLMRFALFRVNDDSYQFVWSHHHISMDGWCLFIILKEVLAYYQASIKNEDIHLKPTRPYKDYISWLRQQDLVAAEKFWQHTLQGFTQPTVLGQIAQADKLSDSSEEGYGQEEISLSASITTLLKSLAQEHKITLNTLIQGVWALLLSRYATSGDVLFGITVSGRSADVVGIDSMIGLFINTLPLRIKVAPEVSFWAWLQNIHAHNEEIRQYEYSSAGQVHQWSEVPGSLPLYESLLVFQNYPTDYSILRSTNLDISVGQVSSQGAQTQYPLTLMVTVDLECKFCLVYDKSCLNSVNINLINKHLLDLIQSIANDTNLNLATLLNQIPAEEIPHIRPRKLRNAISSPRTPVEEILVNIWTEVLKLDQVDIYENFFELGGHSLLATQVISKVSQSFNLQLPLRHLFESPTIVELAKSIEAVKQVTSSFLFPSIKRVSRDIELPLSFAQKRLWFLDQLEKQSSTYNEPAAVYLNGRLDINALEQSFTELLQRQEALRTTFKKVNGEPVQVIAPSLSISLPITDLSEILQEEQFVKMQHLIQKEAQRPFDLAKGPLLRASLLRLGEESYVLLLVIHHIISDGWSIGIFIREFSALYRAFVKGESSPLPELPIQYADFAYWQNHWLQGEVMEKHLSYWKQQLANLPVLELPTDYPRPEIQTFRGSRQHLELPKELCEEIKALSRREGVTLFMTLVAAFKTLMHYCTNQDDIVVGTDVANRNFTETENIIGFFVNQLVLRIYLGGNPTFQELLKRVREVTLAAYEHQDMPFDQLVLALKPERDLSRTLLFQSKFVLQNTPTYSLGLEGLKLKIENIDNGTAKFDLLLNMWESEQGLSGSFEYSTDLFNVSTIAKLITDYEIILRAVVAQPNIKSTAIKEILLTADKQRQDAKQQEFQQVRRQKFKAFKSQPKPTVINLSQQELITESFLQSEGNLPLVITPKFSDLNLPIWAEDNQQFIINNLFKYGGILFRGFAVNQKEDFEQFVSAVCPQLMPYIESSTPRTKLSDKVYTSTEFPADQTIALHNESSYSSTYPMKIWFCCIEPANQGGETPIANVRKVFQRIHPQIRERFQEKGWMLVRNYGNGFGLPWEKAFHTTDKAVMEDYCRNACIQVEWKDSNRLRTRQVRPAIAQHPMTGEMVWFNHVVFWHVSSLQTQFREKFLSEFTEEDLPYNTFYGDGSSIEDSVIAEIREAYQQEMIIYPWKKGDILMLDNMLTAHGRNSYSGSRKILTAMGEPFQHHF
ncbi:TauD/TfdA family dioxygenase [Nostocales cyanobacterium LEGE 12452]|nr:TauD/TfdA family dioxygenase [Nostocales cyanobacterium LEGE 12452]